MDSTQKNEGKNRRPLLIGCISCGAISLCLAALLIIAAGVWFFSGPEGGVKLSNEMDQYALDNLQTNDILLDREELIAYYDGTVSMDGTEAAILTTDRIIYLKDGRSTFIPLHEVTDVQHRYESWVGDIIEITGSSGIILKIEIAPLNQGETFYNALINALENVD